MFEEGVIREFFAWVDADGDGFITVQEIRNACAVDIDGDGGIAEAEKTQTARGWLDLFTQQDLDADQKISLQELLLFNAGP